MKAIKTLQEFYDAAKELQAEHWDRLGETRDNEVSVRAELATYHSGGIVYNVYMGTGRVGPFHAFGNTPENALIKWVDIKQRLTEQLYDNARSEGDPLTDINITEETKTE